MSTREKENINRMDSILKSIEKIKKDSQNQIDEKKDDEKIEDKEETKKVRLGEKLTISEKDAIRRQFYRCWIVPAGAKDLKDLIVSIKMYGCPRYKRNCLSLVKIHFCIFAI